MPRLGKYGKESDPVYELEYVTYPTADVGERGDAGVQEGTASYGMEDLTIGSWAALAERLGRGRDKALRREFREHMYMGGTAR